MKTQRTRTIVLSAALAALLLVGAGSASGAPGGTQAGSHHRRVFILYDPFWYDPFWYDPYWYGPRLYDYDRTSTRGTLKLQVEPETDAKAQVYINGALASEFRHKHSLRLEPGQYEIEARRAGYRSEKQTVRVTAGETLKLNFSLPAAPQAQRERPGPASGR